MKKGLFFGALSLALIGYTQVGLWADGRGGNSGINGRNSQAITKKPYNHTESAADRKINDSIRKALKEDNSLSPQAHAIKVSVNKGVVTLRGPVASAQEKDTIVRLLEGIEGIQKIDNQLDIAH